MNIKKVVFFSTVLVIAFAFLTTSFKPEKDPLHKRAFNLNFTEIKDGQPAKKSTPGIMDFKDGKLYCDFLNQKFEYKWIKYRINKDSIYTDSTDTEVRLLEIEASATDERDQTIMMNFSVVEWDIEGEVKITKNDKLKKKFDFAGREKGGKPKKEKKKKDENNKEATENK